MQMMTRLREAEARREITEESARTGGIAASTFTAQEGHRPFAETLARWHENTPENEAAETARSGISSGLPVELAGHARMPPVRLNRRPSRIAEGLPRPTPRLSQEAWRLWSAWTATATAVGCERTEG
jgi:hypothetical protein